MKREVKLTIFAGPKVYSELIDDLFPGDILNTTLFEKGYVEYMSKLKTLDIIFMFGVESQNSNNCDPFIIMQVSLARHRQCLEEYVYNISKEI